MFELYNTNGIWKLSKFLLTKVDDLKSRDIPQVIAVSDQGGRAPVWGHVLEHQGVSVILEFSVEKAIDRWSTTIPDKVRNSSF